LVSARESTAEPVTAGTAAPRTRRRTDLAAAGLSLLAAFWVTSGAWLDPNHRTIRVNAGDQALFEWLLAYAAHAVAHGHNPLWTDLLNVPAGVNLAVNTAVTVLGVILLPVTLTLGAPVAFLVALTANLAATGYAWYWFISRRLPVGPWAAVLGGLFCGYAPGLVSHANAHLNFTAEWLVPLIVDRVLALGRPGPAPRRGALIGVLVGVLVAVQYSLGGESLFFAALGCAVFLGAWLLAGHREPWAHVWALARGLGVAAVVAALLLAYPLWLQFAGPQGYHGTGFNQKIHSEDVLAWVAFPRRSLAGNAGLSTGLAPNPTEENSFLGLPLLLLVIGVAVVMWRRVLVRALACTALLFAVLSLGPVVKVNGHVTGFPLPYAALAHLPLFDAALPARLALVAIPLVGMLLALAVSALPTLPVPRRRLVAAAVALALLPILPTPLLVMARSPVPHFVTAGTWRQYVRPGETLVPVPPPSDLLPDGQRWQAAALSTGDGATFRIPAGFFLGPGGPDGHGRIGPVPRPTYAMLTNVALLGGVPPIDNVDRLLAADDLRYWHASVVVLPASGGTGNKWSAHHADLLATLTALFGPGTRVDDVWVWRVPPDYPRLP
jgi:hypothetical protein